MAHPFFTIGHSTRSIDEFVDLLRGAGATQVVDVRTVPRSRTNPQYNRDVLGDTLAAYQVGYEHIPGLGGLRGRQRAAGREERRPRQPGLSCVRGPIAGPAILVAWSGQAALKRASA